MLGRNRECVQGSWFRVVFVVVVEPLKKRSALLLICSLARGARGTHIPPGGTPPTAPTGLVQGRK